jgi:hypothetical protein
MGKTPFKFEQSEVVQVILVDEELETDSVTQLRL